MKRYREGELSSHGVLQCREQSLLPFLERILKVDIIVDAVDQARGAILLEHSVEIPAALAKVVVARVSERKDRENAGWQAMKDRGC